MLNINQINEINDIEQDYEYTKYSIFQNKGLSGLVNLGNTCFINSSLQILSHTYELNLFLNNENFKDKLNDKIDTMLLIEWNCLRELLWQKNCIIIPKRFIKTIHIVSNQKKNELFQNFQQNDIAEFILFVLDTFHNSLSREVEIQINGKILNEKDKIALNCYNVLSKMYSKDYSEIIDLFYGLQVSLIQPLKTQNNHNMQKKCDDHLFCGEDKYIKNIVEPFFFLNLCIPAKNTAKGVLEEINLYDCFNLYTKEEILDGDNCVFNELTNKKEEVKKKVLFWNFPKILIIVLKRFNNYNEKNCDKIIFPLHNLDLEDYVVGYEKSQYKYQLYGVCNHHGNIHGGHYTCFIQNANKKWYLFNDDEVTEIDDLNNIVTNNAYCLFYRKKNI